MAYDIPWTPAPSNKFLTLSDVWHQPTVSDMLQLAAFQRDAWERLRNDRPAAGNAESGSGPYDPSQLTNDPNMPGYMGIGNPDGSATQAGQATPLPYDAATSGATAPVPPYEPATDAWQRVPFSLAPDLSYDFSLPVRSGGRTTSQGREGAWARQAERHLLTGLRMMESDNPAAMRMGLSLLRGLDRTGGNAPGLPESLPDSRAYADFSRGLQAILADRSLDPMGKMEALNALSARVQGGGEGTTDAFGPGTHMSAIDAELARRGVV